MLYPYCFKAFNYFILLIILSRLGHIFVFNFEKMHDPYINTSNEPSLGKCTGSPVLVSKYIAPSLIGPFLKR
jgi:hypothetical protein